MDFRRSRITAAATGTVGAVLVAVAAVGAAATAGPPPATAPVEKVIDHLYPTDPEGTTWVADWDAGDIFENDPWLYRGSFDNKYDASDGELRISGDVHRLYVRDPELTQQWGDVEITTYFKRVADDDIPYSGMTIVARSNHLDTSGDDAPCDTRGMSARMRNDGTTDFGKETKHPSTKAVGSRELWPDGLPANIWIGMKYVVYDTDDGAVRQEIWMDTSGGWRGGDWVKVNEHEDRGGWWGEEACAPGIDPTLPLTNDADREGSESGKPNLSVYFRADGLWEDGLVYKWTSVREISMEE